MIAPMRHLDWIESSTRRTAKDLHDLGPPHGCGTIAARIYSTMRDLIGRTLGHDCIVEKIGGGGMEVPCRAEGTSFRLRRMALEAPDP